ncbi:hypothetical protein M422DRAFT_264225 [Sphaerobolus stellatus SS14]|uniref:Major facilitator superfamily (MFS) profile domain-containing protein n=1 Tax=Sphaerobolus stellatus (strain SS14) TaxID=990650 RepID=A0A0C9UWV6_SPHS4|nr:hypothetical protein M422DRAFT_264225 [Sphaerobolus stellatus SS14]
MSSIKRENSLTQSFSADIASSSDSKEEVKEQPPITFPDGGLRAWLNILGCFLLSFSSYGQLNAFGVFQTYYAEHQLKNHTASEISWIGSIQLVLTYFSGVILGRVFDIYGAKGLLITGWILSAFCLMMLSLSSTYYQILLSQGVGLGIGIAIQFYPLLAVPSHWFRSRRAIALGIVIAGSSLSGIIYPIVLSRLFASVGFGWTVRILAFINFGCQAVAIPLVKERLPPRLGLPLVDVQAYKEPTFLYHCITLYTPFWYIEIFSLQKGVNPNLSFYVISIMNAAGLLGRVITGYLADKYGRFNTVIPITFLCGISSLAIWSTSTTVAEIIVFAVIFGATSASYSSIAASCVSQITMEPSRVGARTGMFLLCLAPGILTGPSIAGAILGTSGHSNFLGLQIFVGVLLIAGGVAAVFARWSGAPKLWTKF